MSDAIPKPSIEARAALLRKYRLLCLWRHGKDQSFQAGAAVSDGGLASREAMRALAQEFPGALRELDLLGLPELERRVAVLTRAERSDDQRDEPWIAWILSYHDVMRDVLARKRAAPRRDGAAADGLAHPPEGKLSVAVLREVARRFDLSADRVAAALFPSRRGHA